MNAGFASRNVFGFRYKNIDKFIKEVNLCGAFRINYMLIWRLFDRIIDIHVLYIDAHVFVRFCVCRALLNPYIFFNCVSERHSSYRLGNRKYPMHCKCTRNAIVRFGRQSARAEFNAEK